MFHIKFQNDCRNNTKIQTSKHTGMHIWKRDFENKVCNISACIRPSNEKQKGHQLYLTHPPPLFLPLHTMSSNCSLSASSLSEGFERTAQSEEWLPFHWAGLWMCSLHTAGSHLREIPYCTATQNTFKKGHNPQFKGIYSRAFHHIPQDPFSFLHNPPAPHFSDGAAVCSKLLWIDIS